MLESLFIYGDLPSNVEKGIYQLPLVILSYVVASFASYTALALAQQVVNSKSVGERRLFHWGGAFAMGAGIWSMHFIGMLSYKMRMVVNYDPALTLLSMLIAIAVAYGVLAIVTRERLASWQVFLGAVLLGFGICGMHYTGMAAMKMDAALRYIPGIFLLSVIIAIAASGAALWMAFTLARSSSFYRYLLQIGAALVMGAAICGMHYTGMWASVMIPYADCRYDPNQNFDMLALSIASITSLILGLALMVGIYKRTQTEEQLKITLNEVIIAKKIAENALKEAEIAQKKAEVANRAKTEFLANMSHEIRTPLNTIIGTSELLIHTKLDSKQIEYTKALNTAGDMLLGLINNILDLSKIEAGEFNLLTLPVTVRMLLEETVQIMSELAQANNVTLGISCPNDVPVSILGDPLRLKQILLNLASNAVKFCHDGKVTLKVENRSQTKNEVMLRFSIEDTGPGIPADKLDIIFEKFTQLDDFSTKKYAGTGLGLTICKRLVEMMGGKITVDSVVGQGSVFRFDVAFPTDSDAVIDKSSVQMLFKAKRVLVIDTSHYNRHAMSECLESLGIACDTAISVPVGLTYLMQHPEAYHLLFLDQSLPEMDEKEIDRTLRTFHKVAKLPIVLLTSLKPDEIPPFIQNAGFAAELIKPVSASALLNVLMRLLRAEQSSSSQPSIEKNAPVDHRPIQYTFNGKILLVEDYLPNQKMAKYMLEEMGCEVGLAASGEEALEQLQADRYDLILMDCQMPEMDGFQATAEIRKHDYGRDIVIVAMTANALQGDREKCLAAGMDDYIGKPVRFENLGQMLSKYLVA